MPAPKSSAPVKRSWRQTTGQKLDERSRHVWKWLLTALVVVLCVCAVLWSLWPTATRTLLLVLSGDSLERVLPNVPFVEGDRAALVEWAEATKVARCARPFTDLSSPREFVQQLSNSSATSDRWRFGLEAWNGVTEPVNPGDLLIVYLKGHGMAVPAAGESGATNAELTPVFIKSLGEADLESAAWYGSPTNTVNVADLLRELATLKDIRKLVILDAVHQNYDPRMGQLANNFPAAVKTSIKDLKAENLWVLAGQSSGAELSRGVPERGQSVLVEKLLSLLQQNGKSDSRMVGLRDLVPMLATQLRGMQTPELIFPSAGELTRTGVKLELPKRPFVPPADAQPGPPSSVEKALSTAASAKKTADAVLTASGASAPQVVTSAAALPAEAQHAAARAVSPIKAVSEAVITASPEPPATGSPAPAAPSPGAAAGTTSAAPAPTAANAAAPPPGETKPLSELERAWLARDFLQAAVQSGWSPIHVAPIAWRRIEGLLCSFDERELCRLPLPDADARILAELCSGLEQLRAVFERADPARPRGECEPVARAYERFRSSDSFADFQQGLPGALDPANDAVKTLAEGVYRAADYLRLQGRLSGNFDDTKLRAVLQDLADLRRALGARGAADRRLTESQAQELRQLTSRTKAGLAGLYTALAANAQRVAEAPPSPDKMHVARLLLESPLLAAADRRPLRELAPPRTTSSANAFFDTAPSPLPRNADLWRLLLEQVVFAKPASPLKATPSGRDDPRGDVASLPAATELISALSSRPATEEPLLWAPLGQQHRQFGEALSASLRRANTGKLSAPEMFPLYLASLMVDGRDAASRATAQNFIWLTQPLQPPPIQDRIVLKALEPVTVTGPRDDATPLKFELEIQTDAPAPHQVTLEFDWDRTVLNVASADTKAPLIRPLLISTNERKLTVAALVNAVQKSRGAGSANLRVTAKFADSTHNRDVVCHLPRPDEVDLRVTADQDPDRPNEGWFQRGEEGPPGGRLLLFPNRENVLSFYIKNLSSEDKKLRARLYRLPSGLTDSAKRQMRIDPAKLTDWQSRLVAQTNEKEPLDLKRDHRDWVRVSLLPAAAGPPAASATNSAKPAQEVTSGLLLVLSRDPADSSEPYFKWIDLQAYRPHDLLELSRPRFRDGALSFEVALKDGKYVQQMGLDKQPLRLVWDKQSLPAALTAEGTEKELAAGGPLGAEFLGRSRAGLPWPLHLQFHIDDYPRGLVARLDQNLNLVNLKQNQFPSVRIVRVATSVAKPGAPPEKREFVCEPPEAWLPYPGIAAAEELPTRLAPGELALVRVDEKATAVRLTVDLGADSLRDMDSVKLSLDGDTKEFSRDRLLEVTLGGVEGGSLRLHNQVRDLVGIAFGPLDVGANRRVRLAAHVSQPQSLGRSSALRDTDEVTVVLDRAAPKFLGKVSIAPPPSDPLAAPPVAPTGPGPPGPPKIRRRFQCQVEDGDGSGVAKVEFVYGFDAPPLNGRLDEAEKGEPLPATLVNGSYTADCELQNPGEWLLVEARATDRVGHQAVSGVERHAIEKPTPGGGNRTTFGGKKISEDQAAQEKKP